MRLCIFILFGFSLFYPAVLSIGYSIYNIRVTYQNAQEACKSLGKSLAAVGIHNHYFAHKAIGAFIKGPAKVWIKDFSDLSPVDIGDGIAIVTYGGSSITPKACDQDEKNYVLCE